MKYYVFFISVRTHLLDFMFAPTLRQAESMYDMADMSVCIVEVNAKSGSIILTINSSTFCTSYYNLIKELV